MPTIEAFPTGTAVVVAGWTNPEYAYRTDNTYATSSTDTAEQAYTGFANPFKALGGAETIDKVFVKIKHYIAYTKAPAGTGDSATATASIKVYDGSSWTTYQITALTYTNNEPATDEDHTAQVGNNSNPVLHIDVTTVLNTIAKLQASSLRLLFAVTGSNGVTVTWSVDSVSLIVCYGIVAGIPTREATTQYTSPKAKKALAAVEAYLTS